MTLERVCDPSLFAQPLIVTNREHRYLVSEELRAAGAEGEILLEPVRRDSAAAMASAAALIAGRDRDAIMMVLAADHVIDDIDGFRRTAEVARAAALQGYIVTFGVRPDSPATNYGYIRRGERLPGAEQAFRVASFAEKPDLPTATRYVAEGYLWNSGNFLMPASLVLSEMEKYEPAIAQAAKSAVAEIAQTSGAMTLPLESFESAPRKSFDHAVMEKTDRAAVVEAEFDWHDIGGWETLSELTGRDDLGNTIVGDVVARDTRNCYVHAVRGRIAVIGADNLIVASTGDDVLVAGRDQIDGIKDLVAEVNRIESKANKKHQATVAPWGYHMVVESGPGYQVKRIVVEPGARLSLQRHKHRAEHWVVVSGTAAVTIEKETSRLGLNQSTFIPLGAIHRLANPGEDLLTVIEVQHGDYLGEDDIERLSDDYNRGS